MTFNERIGSRMREARKITKVSLSEVERYTRGEFKASVVGAYERGERAMTVERFVGLCKIYRAFPERILIEAEAMERLEGEAIESQR